MRKLLIILSVLVASVTCFSQSVVPRTNSSYTVMDSRGKWQYNAFMPAYADTTAANIQKGIDSLGAVIFTYDNMSLMVRTGSPKVWTAVGGGGGSSTWGSIAGTLSNQTDLQTALNLKANLASPTFTGTVVIPSPFTLGATSVTATGTQLNYLNAATGTTGTASTNIVFSTSPLFTTPRLASTSTINYVWTATDGSGNGSFQVLPSDNLLFDSLGAAGISPMTTWNNTLYARRISISGGSIDTTASGGLLITISGGSGLFPTTGTGTATGAVIGSLAGNTFNINQGANSFLSIDPTAGAETSFLRVINTTDDDHIGQFVVEATNTSVTAFFEAEFNGGVKRAGLTGFADATSSSITYQADTHTFTGAVTFADLAGNGVGIVGSSNAGLTSFITVGTGLDLTAGVLTATGGGGGTFVGLTDGPGAFAGQAGKSVRVNVGETALEYFTAAGSGDVIKVGTPVNNQLGIWTGDGTIEGDANLTFASSTLNIGVAGAATGVFTLSGVTSGTITIQPASAAGTYTLTLPTTDGGANEFLQTNGSGVLTWAAGGGTPALTQYRLAVGDASNLLSTGAAITGNRALISDANGVPTHATTTATEIGYVNGVTSAIQTQLDNKVFALNVFCGTITAFTDDQEIFYFAQVGVPVTTATFYSLVIDRTCTLIAASITMRLSTVGTGEAWSMYVRVNDATDYLIETVSSIASRRTWNNNALNTTGISLSPGDEIVIKMVNPPWATNPATGVVNGYLTFR